jgi:hypothetical protein
MPQVVPLGNAMRHDNASNHQPGGTRGLKAQTPKARAIAATSGSG